MAHWDKATENYKTPLCSLSLCILAHLFGSVPSLINPEALFALPPR